MLAPLDPSVILDGTPDIAAPKPQRWKFWGTTLWAVAMVATFMAVGAVLMFATMMVSIDPATDPSDDYFRALLHSRQTLEIAAFAAAAACALGIMALAIRLAGIGMAEYLGLIRPRLRDIGIGVAGLLVIYVVFWLLLMLVGNPPSRFAVDLYRQALADGSWPVLLFAIAVAAPVLEELFVRGFLFRGWAASRLGPVGAIVLTSMVWAASHTQYDWLVMIQIFSIGLLYGWIRRRGGSTVATMILHAGQNAWSFAFFEILERLGLLTA
jgi:membrane protease YdiL (CAAX protease family)